MDGKFEEKNGYKLYWIGIGKKDINILYDAVQQYMAKLDKMGMRYEYHKTNGGHTWSEWRDYLVLFAPKLSK